MEGIIFLCLLPFLSFFLILLFWIIRGLKDKREVSNASKTKQKDENERSARRDQLNRVIYDLCRPDEYFHEFTGAYTDKFRKITDAIVVNLYEPYTAIRERYYSDTNELKNLHLEIERTLSFLNETYSYDFSYADIPLLYQCLHELIGKIFAESNFEADGKTINIISEIRERGKCFVFCVEIVENGSEIITVGKPVIYETDIERNYVVSVDSAEKERLLKKFSEKSQKVRIELEKQAEKQAAGDNRGGRTSAPGDGTYRYSRNNASGSTSTGSGAAGNARDDRGGRTSAPGDGTYRYSRNNASGSTSTGSGAAGNARNDRGGGSSGARQGGNRQNEQSGRRNTGTNNSGGGTSSKSGANARQPHGTPGSDKTEIELYIERMSEGNSYYRYFIGCKTYADVRKRRNELVKQFHPDLGKSGGEEISYINPIFEELKEKFGSSK